MNSKAMQVKVQREKESSNGTMKENRNTMCHHANLDIDRMEILIHQLTKNHHAIQDTRPYQHMTSNFPFLWHQGDGLLHHDMKEGQRQHNLYISQLHQQKLQPTEQYPQEKRHFHNAWHERGRCIAGYILAAGCC